MSPRAAVRWFIPRALLALLLAAPWLPRASALTIDPELWQQLVEQADLVAVVECAAAGGVVARYRVEESWKGDVRAGELIVLARIASAWSDTYPVSFVGQRFVVTATRPSAARVTGPARFPGSSPEEWREIVAEFHTGPFQGLHPLDPQGRPAMSSFANLGSERETLTALRDDVRQYVELPEPERAFALLRALLRKYGEHLSTPTGANLEKSATHDDLIRALIEAWDTLDGRRSFIERMIDQASPLTRRRVAELARTPQDSSRSELLAAARKSRIHDVVPVAPSPVPPEQIATAVYLLNQNARTSPATEGALGLLIALDPWRALPALKAWTARAGQRHDRDLARDFASHAAALCTHERERFLTELLAAREPLIRVSAAVHLAFENERKGREALRVFCDLPDEAGAWAAVTLMRYGEGAAIGRAIKVYAMVAAAGENGSAFGPQLAFRFAEIVSNTAAKNGVPFPIEELDDATVARIRNFFPQHPDVTPVDPWLAEFRSRKID